MSTKGTIIANVYAQLERLGLSRHIAHQLRLAAKGLERWAILEDGLVHFGATTWAMERDVVTGVPYIVTYHSNCRITRRKIRDMEKFHVERIERICQGAKLSWHFEGCTLFVDDRPIPANDTRHAVMVQ